VPGDSSSDKDAEDFCTDDVVETSDEESGSSSSSSDDNSSDDSIGDGSEDSDEPNRNKGTSFAKLVEKKITDFFRAKPRPRPRRPSPRPQEPKPQEQDHRECHMTRICHFFRRHPPDPEEEDHHTEQG
jgi:hypothetical protein